MKQNIRDTIINIEEECLIQKIKQNIYTALDDIV